MTQNNQQLNDFIEELEKPIGDENPDQDVLASEIINTTQTHMDTMTEVNNNYDEVLRNLMGELEEIKETENQIKDAKKIVDIKKNLLE
jgi:DNA repair ATPase RecN